MARITLRQLLDHAAERGYGVPAFNINNMEQGLAIMEAAAAVDAPVIIQASRGARSYANDIMLSKMIDALEEMHPQIPLCLHQDHGNEEATCATALQARLYVGHDGRLAQGRRQDRGGLRLQRRYHPPRGRDGALDRRLGRRRTGRARFAGAWRRRAGGRPWRRRRGQPRSTADRSRTRRSISSAPPRSTRWRSRWAPRTAPTNSRASRMATSSP